MEATQPVRSLHARLMVALLLIAGMTTADTTGSRWECAGERSAATSANSSGRLMILPGVANTRFQLAGFVERAQAQLPGFQIDVRPWGIPLLTLHNLRAYERNMATAAAIAEEITAWRRAHPTGTFYLAGYSGGGGMAALIVRALPADVVIDRLILIAPAISADYALDRDVLPHVRELVVNFASERDLQVGWGTRTFGTIDRKATASAGAVGFNSDDSRVLQRHWTLDDAPYGHRGNHLAYLGGRWQSAKLLPTIDPALTAEQVLAHWARTCKEE
ncbi:MAG TPA: hypothetical protein VJA26_15240 [Gammaproteobacteria bacterium]|nr:hypothetical protein [Gammaproteobacteria bacterium]